jgi:hypothetical protein
MADSDKDRGRNRRSSAEDRGWSHRPGTQMARWSVGRVMSCAVYTVHMKARSAGFLVEPQKQGLRFVSGLASKPLRRFSPVWPQNQWLGFFCWGLKIVSSGLLIWALKSPLRFLGLGLKTKQTLVCWLRHKTDGGRMAWDTRRELAACFTWKQVALWFPCLASTLVDARRQVVHVAPSQRLCQNQIENGRVDTTGCVGPCYTYFAIFYLSDPRSIVVF